MYKLKNVYATISFERNKINLLVVECTHKHQTNCLYYNSIEHDYLDQNVVFLNHDNLIEKLRILINGA
ncbi:MAG: hypothetical protein LBD63_01135, partial [Mycoplasmataceae bacterium]|nr:hypothetical protein [Mycoplasmataceae bacterium]